PISRLLFVLGDNPVKRAGSGVYLVVMRAVRECFELVEPWAVPRGAKQVDVGLARLRCERKRAGLFALRYGLGMDVEALEHLSRQIMRGDLGLRAAFKLQHDRNLAAVLSGDLQDALVDAVGA